MRMVKGAEVFDVKDPVQIAAFKAAGYAEQVEEKPKRTRKAKAESDTE